MSLDEELDQVEATRKRALKEIAEILLRNRKDHGRSLTNLAYELLREAVEVARQDRQYREIHAAKIDGAGEMLQVFANDVDDAGRDPDKSRNKVFNYYTVFLLHASTILTTDKASGLQNVDRLINSLKKLMAEINPDYQPFA